MTKWFDTNYHYLVPEIGPDTPLRFADDTITRRFTDAREWGYVTRPVLVGPVTYLALAKADPATPDFDPLTRIDEAVAAYEEAPGGRQVSQTVPPSGIENEEWGP